MWVVGLTGGIGSGKSTVAKLFAAHGVPVVDTDAIARRLTERGGEALDELRDAFGDAVFLPDGELDRAALRRRVFADASARKRLEAILHPRIREAVVRALDGLVAPYAVVVIPLLVETGHYQDLLDRVLVVDCPETLQIERVMARNGLSREEVESMLAAQATRAERLAVADDVITNTVGEESLTAAVEALHARYLGLAKETSA